MGQTWKYFEITFIIFILLIIQNCTTLSTEKDETSLEDDLVPGTHVLPKQIFNEGKPFYVDKDPISGQLDFSSKKPAGIEPEINEVIDTQSKTVIFNNLTPNIHDYLNLPVKYSSSKFVYPLVSSSYANLKYQGNNKNFLSHHKESTISTTTSPKYYTLRRTTNDIKFISTTPSTTSSKTTPTTTTPTSSTTHKTTATPLIVHTTVEQNRTTPTKSSTTTTTLSSSSAKTTTEKVALGTTMASTADQTTTKSVQKPEKTSATKKIVTLFKKHPSFHTTYPMRTSPEPSTTTTTTITTTTSPPTTTTISTTTSSTTKDITTTFIPTTPPTITTTTSATTTSTTTRPPTTFSTTPSTTTLYSTITRLTTPSTNKWNDYHISEYSDNQPSFHFLPSSVISSTDRNYVAPNDSGAFQPISSTTVFPTLSPDAVYNEIVNKKESNKMSLMDLFNALAEEDYYPSGYENEPSEKLNSGILPSQPAPFTLQKVTNQNPPNYTSLSQNFTEISPNDWNISNISKNSNTVSFPGSVDLPNTHSQDGIIGDQKEYVRYQVQQPTVMQQYGSVPNTNNVIISPDQDSASFVVGSQQSVHHSNYMGSVDKVPLFDNSDFTSDKMHSDTSSPINLGLSSGYVHAPEYHVYENQNWNIPQGFKTPLQSSNSENNEEMKTNYDNTKIKFPNQENQNVNINNGLMLPEALIQNKVNVAFPANENNDDDDRNTSKNPERSDKIVFTEEKTPIQRVSFAEPLEGNKKEILTLNKYNLQKQIVSVQYTNNR